MTQPRHVVFLIHGIRTQGEWAQRAAAVLASDASIRVRPIRYEFLDVIRFVLPWERFRQRPVHRVAKLIRDELSRGPAQLSIVAHSFGTFIVSRILEQEADLRFHRLVLCGSIVPDTFEWERYGHRLGTDSDGDWQVLNDCGMNDMWPVLAYSVTWGYGSSGRFGFGHPRVKDRFFDVGHSGFFGKDFVSTYWLPYVCRGEVVEGVLERPTTSWFVSLLTVLKLRYVLILAAVLLVAFGLSAAGMALPSVGPTGLTQASLTECRGLVESAAEEYASILTSYATTKDPAPRVICERLLKQTPDNAEVNGLFARALIKEGRLEEAIARLQRAATLGDFRSHLILGYYFLYYREPDLSRAIEHLTSAAKGGEAEASFALGKTFELGTLGAPNFLKAAEYYSDAAQQGVIGAKYRLAELYRFGLGVSQDLAKAKALYREAAGTGHSGAVEALNDLESR